MTPEPLSVAQGAALRDTACSLEARAMGQPTPPRIRLQVKVVPGSSRACIAGWLGETLRVRVTAPPERGKANAAVEALLADALELAPEAVRIVAGHTSARKIVELTGLSDGDLKGRLSRADRE